MYERKYNLALPSGVAGATVTVRAENDRDICTLASIVYSAWGKYIRDIHVPYGLGYKPVIREDLKITIEVGSKVISLEAGDPVYAVYLIGATQDESTKIEVETERSEVD